VRPALPLVDLAARVRPGVVHLRSTIREPRGPDGRVEEAVSVGSGFLIDPRGYVVTNEHVIRGAVDVRVRLFDGRELVACVVGQDEPTDIALLEVEAPGPLPVLPLGDSDAVRVGETAVTVGSPFGFAHSMTAGIVSAKERVIESDPRSENARANEAYMFFIQTDAAINVGNSGGPLVDAWGAVIGVNAAYWGGSQPSQGVGFAIPANIIKVLLPRLRAEGEAPRSYLGVDSQPLTAGLAVALALPNLRGALLAFVEPGSAAERAGLEVGDVVTSWNGRPIATRDDFKIYAQLTGPGTTLEVGIVRDGKASKRQLTTKAAAREARPRHAARCGQAMPGPDAGLGFEVEATPGGKVRVRRVSGGPAREAGLEQGEVILRVGAQAVRSVSDLWRLLGEAPRDRPIPLLIEDAGRPYWTALPRRRPSADERSDEGVR
jgi:serine protease Do